MRQWGGVCDMTPDYSPILGEAPQLKGFVLDVGWGAYGFKAGPVSGARIAELVHTGKIPKVIRPFSPTRFAEVGWWKAAAAVSTSSPICPPCVSFGGGISSAELLQEFGQISVCQIADAVGSSLAMDSTIRPLDMSFRICAPAFTVLCPADDNLTLHHALHLAKAGQVLMVSGSRSHKAALWGELVSISAQSRGLRGTIIDGPARDPREIAALKYPVFARSIQPRRASKERYGKIGGPIQFGELTVNSGDIVMADCNGIVAFPADRLRRCWSRPVWLSKRNNLNKILSTGKSYFELAGLSSLVPSEQGTRGL